MEEAIRLIEVIDQKINVLIGLNSSIKKENKALKEKISELNHIVEHQKIQIKELKEKNYTVEETISFDTKADNALAKKRIVEIVREVDRCIDLLNK